MQALGYKGGSPKEWLDFQEKLRGGWMETPDDLRKVTRSLLDYYGDDKDLATWSLMEFSGGKLSRDVAEQIIGGSESLSNSALSGLVTSSKGVVTPGKGEDSVAEGKRQTQRKEDLLLETGELVAPALTEAINELNDSIRQQMAAATSLDLGTILKMMINTWDKALMAKLGTSWNGPQSSADDGDGTGNYASNTTRGGRGTIRVNVVNQSADPIEATVEATEEDWATV
jgi:hypothetical protein